MQLDSGINLVHILSAGPAAPRSCENELTLRYSFLQFFRCHDTFIKPNGLFLNSEKIFSGTGFQNNPDFFNGDILNDPGSCER